MREEVFGPILPVISFKDFDEVIDIHINGKNSEKPLAIYYFGNSNSKNFQRLQNETSSGNLTANDVLHHSLDIELGFGGVGQSGIGRVGGYDGFKNMSNAKSIVTKWQMNVYPYNYVCPPYGKRKNKTVNFLMSLLPAKQNFILRFVLRVFALYVLYMICLGRWGKSRFRKEIYQILIKFL
tara:strand:- start:116 stop:658 length:543 start_codon:yes stop_codon:yes gene_type:complete